MTSPSPSNNLLQGNGAPDTADATAAGADASSSASSRNPLLCFLCEDYYDDPCILICFHTFCAKCVRGKNQDGKINCPLCGRNGKGKAANWKVPIGEEILNTPLII